MIGAWAVGPVAFAEARCRIESTAAALQRLEVWGKEWAGAQGAVAAHSSRHVAWVADRSGTVLEALILVTVQNTDRRSGLTADYRRPQWIHCSGGNG
ncbi:MAG: hypothetical protein IPL59_16955 [Candidatus Competibacteraceae bacterium]|nr:hypothetical protein [Candidatus Competibacteraceae bacterium]MBK8752216.1 hypothetical protein [Candidatus Competibacteraceae bacterium]